jgi:hypothetical protein
MSNPLVEHQAGHTLEYIHYNPVQAGICNAPEEYYYSSANFYHSGKDDFNMLVDDNPLVEHQAGYTVNTRRQHCIYCLILQNLHPSSFFQ